MLSKWMVTARTNIPRSAESARTWIGEGGVRLSEEGGIINGFLFRVIFLTV